MKLLRTSKRDILLSRERPLVMAVLNATPDSFSDGGRFDDADSALRRVEKMVEEGADLLDIGGESTRPGSVRVGAEEETARVLPVIEAVTARFGIPVSIDTTKREVARRALEAGAEIVNDVSGLRFEPGIAEEAARTGAALVLMHSRGEFESMHRQPPVDDMFGELFRGLGEAVGRAEAAGVERRRICLDPGIGFGKTPEQNLEIVGRLGSLCEEFPDLPVLVGASRKSFIGKLLDGAAVGDRLNGTLAVHAVAAWNGADIVRAHDVRATRELLQVVGALRGSVS